MQDFSPTLAKMRIAMAKPAKTSKSPAEGRKSAYFARNRLAIINSTQEVLALIGPTATIDQVAEHAEVSVSTIYKHFESKELLFQAAFSEAMNSWEKWAFDSIQSLEDPLERLVIPMRLFPRIKRTHPVYAGMAAKNSAELPAYIPTMAKGFQANVTELVKNKILTVTNIEIRFHFVMICIAEILLKQVHDPRAKESDIDTEIEILLGMLGISSTSANKLCSSELPNSPGITK
jgi:AcrR family transcriptional regulator